MSAFIGSRAERVEDARILAGAGTYIADRTAPGLLHACFVRSPYASARVSSIDATSARKLGGVAAVFTSVDLEACVAPMRARAPMPGYKRPQYGALASDVVRFTGDPVAIVVAADRYLAEDACDLVDVDYEPLQPVMSVDEAIADGAPLVFEELGSNVLYEQHFATEGLDRAFATCAHVVRERFVQSRCANVPMETRGGLATYDPTTGDLVYYASHQAPHVLRLFIADLLGQPLERMRVICDEVGGSFGQKWSVGREDVAVCAASRLLGRPVKWIEDRAENLAAAGQAREETIEAEIAVAESGEILGIRARMTLDHGSYPVMTFPLPIVPANVRVMLPGPYRVPEYGFDALIVATNKASYGAYRGPWAAETLVRERLLDRAAVASGLDAREIRAKNLQASRDPAAVMITGPSLAGATARDTFEQVERLYDFEEFSARQTEAREQGRYLGVGLATFIEPAPGPASYRAALGVELGPERVVVRLEPDGHATVTTSQVPNGQGHETTLAQVVAEQLTIPLDQVRVVHGDTSLTPFSLVGTGGSRAAALAGGAALYAGRAVRNRALRVASELLEAAPDDLELIAGEARVRGTPDRSLSLAAIARAAYFRPELLPDGQGPGLEAHSDYAGSEDGGWSQATHLCEVEVDVQTGQVTVLAYLVVEDCGRMINPAIVEGQIRGGIAQGIGQVFYEHSAYSPDGAYLASTFMDYLVPTASDVPDITIEHVEPVSAATSPEFAGVGEGGAIVSPPTLMAAVEDALRPFECTVVELPLTPTRILELVGAITPEDGSL